MRLLIATLCFLTFCFAKADTMDHYMNIFNQIPQMEMKADPQSQAWARSAKSVLTVTNEAIAETLLQANELATTQGKSLFCLPEGVSLNATTLHDIILRAWHDNSSQQSDKDRMSVSQMAWLGVVKAFPCQQTAQQMVSPFTRQGQGTQAMQHANGTPENQPQDKLPALVPTT